MTHQFKQSIDAYFRLWLFRFRARGIPFLEPQLWGLILRPRALFSTLALRGIAAPGGCATIATSCCASTSSGLRGYRVDSMCPSCMARVTAAQATRSARYLETESFAHRVHVVPARPSAASAGHRSGASIWITRSTAPISMPVPSGGGAKCTNLPRLQLLLDHQPLRRRQRPVMRARNRLPSQLVQRPSQPLGHLPAVHKQNRRVTRANNLQQPRMDCIPNRNSPWSLRGRSAGKYSCSPSRAISSTEPRCAASVALARWH